MGGFFHLENGDDEIAKSHMKKVGGSRDRKRGLGKFNIIFFLSGSTLQILFYFIFLIEKSRKQDHSRILLYFHKARMYHSPASERIVMKEKTVQASLLSFHLSALPWDSHQVLILFPANLRKGSFKYDSLKIQKDGPIMVGFQP